MSFNPYPPFNPLHDVWARAFAGCDLIVTREDARGNPLDDVTTREAVYNEGWQARLDAGLPMPEVDE